MTTKLSTIINENVSGNTFISINTSTDVKLRGGKKNELQGRVRKITTGLNVMVYQNKTTNAYENMINKRLKKEGKQTTFEVGPRKWGERITNTPFVTHNEQAYLEVICLHPGTSHYEVDGVKTDADAIEGLPPVQDGGDQGGLDDKVIIRTFKVDSITAITINKEKHTGPFTY